MKFSKTMMAKLRAMGYRRTFVDRYCATYERPMTDRVVEVQLWHGGAHRACHMRRTPDGLLGSTVPTRFRDIDEMMRAVRREETRVDGRMRSVLRDRRRRRPIMVAI